MCGIQDVEAMDHDYVEEKRSRRPKHHERDVNEQVIEFREEKIVGEEDDEHYQAIKPYIPDKSIKPMRSQMQEGVDDEEENSAEEDFDLDATTKLQ